MLVKLKVFWGLGVVSWSILEVTQLHIGMCLQKRLFAYWNKNTSLTTTVILALRIFLAVSWNQLLVGQFLVYKLSNETDLKS